MDRLQKQITKRKISNTGWTMLGASLPIMMVGTFIKTPIFFIMSVTFCFIGIFIALFFQHSDKHIFKPFREKLKLIGEYKDRVFVTDGATIHIYGYGKDSYIKVGIPNIKGATIKYRPVLGYEMSNTMEIALEERKISPYEFYIKYIEPDLLDSMTKTYNEINSERIKLGESVFEFIDNKDKTQN